MTGILALQPPNGIEWIVILLIAVLLFGAKKLPDLGASVGKSIRNFKKGMDEGRAEDEPGSTEPVTAETTTTETTTKTQTPS